MRHHRWLIFGCIAIIGGSVLFFALQRLVAHDGGKDREKTAAESPAGGEKANLGFAENRSPEQIGKSETYETVGVEVENRRENLRVTGSLAADEISNVASNVNGIVMKILVDRGSVVKKGELMVELDSRDAENKLGEGLAVVEELKAKLSLNDVNSPFDAEEQPEVKLAKATRNLADSRFKRAENLLPQKAISVDEFEQIRAEADCAEQRYQQAVLQIKQTYQLLKTNVARLAAMKKAVADTKILAPFDGYVVEKHVALGEQVTGGFIASKVITVVRTSPLRISLTVPQQHIDRIVPGQKVAFQADSFPDKKFEGEIRYISPVVSSDTRSLVVEAITQNAGGQLRPGLFVTAQIELPEQRADLFVPASAVQKMGDVARVFVVRDDGVHEQVVALGKSGDNRVEILSGLKGTERIVRNPEKVREGAQVRK
jgi:RND family efflux transporter MFP subunit